jgi:hypothetical protein
VESSTDDPSPKDPLKADAKLAALQDTVSLRVGFPDFSVVAPNRFKYLPRAA